MRDEGGATATAAALLGALLPEGAVCAATDPGRDRPAPRFGEAAAVARARPGRQREFAAGRAAAARAMAALGLPPAPLPAGADRAPVWPPGLVGSIAHDGRVCLAALARQDRCAGIGIDVEPDAPLPADLLAAVCTETERAHLARLPAAEAGRAARLAFSAKESLYKCQYPLTGRVLEFDEVEIFCEGPAGAARGRFAARLCRAAGPFPAGARFAGQFARAAGLLVTLVALPAGTSPGPAPRTPVFAET